MSNKTSLFSIAIGCGMIISGFAYAKPQMPDITGAKDDSYALPSDSAADLRTPEEIIADSIARADSLALELTETLNRTASDLYKNLKVIQYDGVTEQELYPQVMATYRATLEAIDAPRATETDAIRHRSVLTDLAPMLMRGAIYHSRNQSQKDFTNFATAYVDTRLNPLMSPATFASSTDNVYHTLIYAAASGAYNSNNFGKAADYLEAYLRTGDTSHRENAYVFLGQAALNCKEPERCVEALLTGVELYPANYNLMMLALQCCLDADETDRIQAVLDKALLLHPNDEQLLNIQARMFENEGNYADALGYWQKLYELKPNSLSVNQHLALSYYNLGADYYNKAIMESDEKLNKRYMRQSNAYFGTAADDLQRIVENDPTNDKYLLALAKTYGCLGEKERLDEINNRLAALGVSPVRINDMPDAITVDNHSVSHKSATEAIIPDFQTFASKYVSDQLEQWAQIREFEKLEDFQKRVNEFSIQAEHKRLSKEAEVSYLNKYARRFRISDMKLLPYDAENECYKVESSFGDFVLNVPLKNREAEIFKSQWETAQVRDPKYIIDNNRVAIASLSIVTSSGKSYHYTSDMASNYDYTPVTIDYNSILGKNGDTFAQKQLTRSQNKPAARVVRAKSDVDENIPFTSRISNKTLALIIGNENYQHVATVDNAQHDGETFAEYCRKTLGVPEKQVIYHPDITLGGMISALDNVKRLINALGDGVDLILYYSGHGFPDENSKDAYLLPVDGNGVSTASAYSLKKFYDDLTATGAENVMVFLDACFSGASRDGDMIVKARGVALKPNHAEPNGNMFVLSATSDQQTAMSYPEKHHGLFTYFLLKKLQESKGNASLKELSDYVTQNVKERSVPVNGKDQTPRHTVKGKLAETWGTKKLRP